MGVAAGVKTEVWATAGQQFDRDDQKYDNEPFLSWVVAVLAAPPPIPAVFSLSYQDFEDSLQVKCCAGVVLW